MKTSVLASLLASLPAAFALPEVVAKPLPEGCQSYPQYNADTDIAGPWVIKLVNSENTAIDGFGNTNYHSVSFDPRVDRKPKLRWGHINFPTRNDIAKTPLRCSSGALQGRVPTDLTAAGAPTNFEWTPLVLSPYPYDAGLMWKIEGAAPRVFEHYVDGEKQPGVFLGGYDNSTAWGLKYYPANVGSSNDFYYLRLLGPNSQDPTTGEKLNANETRAFVAIDAVWP